MRSGPLAERECMCRDGDRSFCIALTAGAQFAMGRSRATGVVEPAATSTPLPLGGHPMT